MQKQNEKHHWKTVANSSYLGAADFPDNGGDLALTIARVAFDEVVTTEKGDSEKTVIHWAEAGYKPLIVNVTNAKTIAKVTGKPYMEDWTGARIQLFVQSGVRAFGEIVDAVRVRPYRPRIASPAAQEQPPVPACADCGQVIAPAMGRDARWLASYTSRKYGRALCSDCAQKAAAKAAETAETAEAAEAAEADNLEMIPDEEPL